MIGLKAGMRVGIPLTILSLIITGLYDTGHLPGAVQAVELLVLIVGICFAGWSAGRQAGRATQGATAGLITSVFPAVVILGANIVMALVAPAQFAQAFGYHDMNSSALVVASITQSAFGLVGWAIFGLLFGVSGGWFGSKQHAKLSEPVRETVAS